MRGADPGSQLVRFAGSAEREGKAGGDQESPRARESWIIGLGVPTVAAASLRNGTADLQRKNLVRHCWGFSLAAPMPSLSPAPESWSSLLPRKKGRARRLTRVPVSRERSPEPPSRPSPPRRLLKSMASPIRKAATAKMSPPWRMVS